MCLDAVKWTAHREHTGKVEREENNFHNVYLVDNWWFWMIKFLSKVRGVKTSLGKLNVQGYLMLVTTLPAVWRQQTQICGETVSPSLYLFFKSDLTNSQIGANWDEQACLLWRCTFCSKSANGQRLGGRWVRELLLCLRRKQMEQKRAKPLRRCLASLITFESRRRAVCCNSFCWYTLLNVLSFTRISINSWKAVKGCQNDLEFGIRPIVKYLINSVKKYALLAMLLALVRLDQVWIWLGSV